MTGFIVDGGGRWLLKSGASDDPEQLLKSTPDVDGLAPSATSSSPVDGCWESRLQFPAERISDISGYCSRTPIISSGFSSIPFSSSVAT